MLTGRRGCGGPGCHAPRSKLARVETIWVMVTDSTVDSGSTSSRLPKQIARSRGHRQLADGLGQHGARQVHGGHMATWLVRTW